MNTNHISRREFLKTAGAGLAAAALAGCNLPGRERVLAPRPNILYIMTDDHASHAISCYGSKINRTPNLDRIAAEGVRFDNCFCTNSLCAPVRAVVLTGKYSHLNGVLDNSVAFDGAQQTFPKLLQENGYQTALVGKWHLGSDPTGFDYWNILPGQGNYYNPDLIEMGQRKRREGYVTDIITDICIDWLRNRDRSRPFCMMYHHKAPHREWEPDAKHLTMYADVRIPEPPTLFDDWAAKCDAARQQEMTLRDHLTDKDLKLTPPPRLNPQQRQAWDAAYEPENARFRQANPQGDDLVRWKYQRYIKDYLRCIASVDDNVGRVLDFLDREGLADDTLVVYCSDQGFFLGDHGWFDKRFMYEEAYRMPLLVRYPRMIRPGSVCSEIVMNVDFAPTFLDLAGIAVPPDMQGRSLTPLLAGNRLRDWRQAAYYHYFEYPAVHSVKRHYGIRTKRYKLIHFYYDIDAWELYDLRTDPEELHNVYDDPAYANVREYLTTELYRLKAHYGDTRELEENILQTQKQARTRPRTDTPANPQPQP